MFTTEGDHGVAVLNGSAVLLARLVDRAGRGVPMSGIRAIEYSLYEIDPWWPNHLTVVAGHDAVSVDIGEVIFDTLQLDGLWTVDSVGYNFRHELSLGDRTRFPQPGFQYEMCYWFTLADGQKTAVRLQLRC
jgi:hypothetical protein